MSDRLLVVVLWVLGATFSYSAMGKLVEFARLKRPQDRQWWDLPDKRWEFRLARACLAPFWPVLEAGSLLRTLYRAWIGEEQAP